MTGYLGGVSYGLSKQNIDFVAFLYFWDSIIQMCSGRQVFFPVLMTITIWIYSLLGKMVAFLESQVVVHPLNYEKSRSLFINTGLYICSSLQEVLVSLMLVSCPRGIRRLFIPPLTVSREFLTPCTCIAQTNPALLWSWQAQNILFPQFTTVHRNHLLPRHQVL